MEPVEITISAIEGATAKRFAVVEWGEGNVAVAYQAPDDTVYLNVSTNKDAPEVQIRGGWAEAVEILNDLRAQGTI